MKEISDWRKNFMKVSGYVFISVVIIIVIYYVARLYISSAVANFILGDILLAIPTGIIVRFLDKYIKARHAKKLNL